MEDPYSTFLSTSPKQNQRHGRSKQSTSSTSIGASEPSQPWTATRCHRLLRPLLAHIAALRKDKERRAVVRNSQSSTVTSQATKSRRTVLGKRSYPADDSDYDDKKPCRKYSRKASHRRPSTDQSCTPQRNVQRQRRQPDNKAAQDVVLPTPFLRRVRNHQLSSPAKVANEPSQEEPGPATRCSHSGGGCRTKCAFELELAGFRLTIDVERHGLYESVFKAFDSILRVTSPRKNQAAGPKSLIAMCLRQVPAYIAGLEEWERQESKENGTKSAVQGAGVSFEVYSELESLGVVDGWRHLCLLVRAHAVQIIQDAVAEGLIEDPVTGLLIRVCLEYMPPMEFTGLIRTFVIRQYPRPHSANDDLFASPALQPLRILKNCDPSGTSTMARILADLLTDDLLPADWVLNKSFISLWPSTVRHATKTKACQDALDFIVITLELLCGLASPRKPRGAPQTRLRGKSQTTLISAVAALGSVFLLCEEGSTEPTETSSTTRAATLHRRMHHIVTTCSANLKRRKSAGGSKLGIYLLALCSFLSLSSSTPPPATQTATATKTTLSTAWHNVPTCHGNPHLMLQYDATVALMSAVAHHCSRGTGLAPHVYLERFCDRLQEELDLPRAALGNMRVDGAFRLAEYTGDLRDLAVAEGLRGRMVLELVTPAKRKGMEVGEGIEKQKKVASFSGIRWDDGISEWVAATPGSDVRQAAVRRGPRLRSEGLVEGEAEEGDDGVGVESEKEGVLEAETDTASVAPNEIDSDSSPSDDETDDGSTSETDDEAETDTLSPNTEASLVSVSKSAEPEPEPESLPQPSPNHPDPGNDDDDDHNQDQEDDDDHNHNDTRPQDQNITSHSPQPPPASLSKPSRSFLTARPRRLSRPVSTTRAEGDDELALDDADASVTHEERETWLCRKKPARFRPGAGRGSSTTTTSGGTVKASVAMKSGAGTTTAGAGSGNTRGSGTGVGGATSTNTGTATATGAGRTRVARASLVYLQPRLSSGAAVKRRRSGGYGYGGGRGEEGESDDELSIF